MMLLGMLAGLMIGSGVTALLFPRLAMRLTDTLISNVRRSRRVATEHAGRSQASNLALVGWTPTDLVTRQLVGVVIGAISAATLGVMYGLGTLVLVLCLVGGVVGFMVPLTLLQSRARVRRRTFVHAFSAYLDLVNVLLAGGAGIETALTSAAEVGDGWAFGTLRATLVRARLSRRSPWTELRALGARWGIDELVEVAGSMSLSGDHGARIRTSLAARADSMRSRQVAEVEASAQSATERMGVPMMMLFVGFMALLGYPALQTVVMNM
jgi:Flp pilus assembly protein TadB